jgi:hypothetical protein
MAAKALASLKNWTKEARAGSQGLEESDVTPAVTALLFTFDRKVRRSAL